MTSENKENLPENIKDSNNINEILSSPAQISKEWCTMCALTARMNWLEFHVFLPIWNAFAALEHPAEWCIWTLPKWKENKLPDNSWSWIEIKDLMKAWEKVGADIADIAITEKIISKTKRQTSTNLIWDLAVESKSPNWKIYGHRAIACNVNWNWFVLDPYFNGIEESVEKWIPLDEYMRRKKVIKCNFYKSDWYDFDKSREIREAIRRGESPLTDTDKKKYDKVMEYVQRKDDEKTRYVAEKIKDPNYSFDMDDVYQFIDDNESDMLYKLLIHPNCKLKLNGLLSIFKERRQKKLAVFVNTCRFFDRLDQNFQREIVDLIIENTGIRWYIDAVSYYWMIKTFWWLDDETKLLLINQAIEQFDKTWEEEQWVRQYHFDEKYNSNIPEQRKAYKSELEKMLVEL